MLRKRLCKFLTERTGRSEAARNARFFSQQQQTHVSAQKEVSSETKLKNAGTAALLLAFVGGVYYSAIAKMKQGVSKYFCNLSRVPALQSSLQ